MRRVRCESCGVDFLEVEVSGRRRQYHSNACRQAAYRARSETSGHEARDARSGARQWWADLPTGREVVPAGLPTWCRARAEDEQLAARRRKARRLMERALSATGPEAAACQERAEAIRGKYGL